MVFKRLGQLACTGKGLLPDDAAREFWELVPWREKFANVKTRGNTSLGPVQSRQQLCQC